MKREGLTLLEIVVLFVVIGILATLLIPRICPPNCPHATVHCSSNLRQLYQLGALYASTHQGKWPDATGSALWLSFAKTSPPLIPSEELEVLLCPVRGESELGQCDYLGPSKPVSQLKPGDALAADKPGNHGEGYGGNVLLRDGSIAEYESLHPIWDTLDP